MHSAARTRLAVVLSHPVQYYSPWFRWLAAHTDLDFRVFYLDDSGVRPRHDEKFGRTFAWDVDLLGGYESEFVPNRAKVPDTLRFSGLWNPGLFARLTDWSPNALLLFGYKYRTHLALIAWARARRIPLIFRGDSHLIGRPAPSTFSRLALTLVYRQFAALTYVGYANRDYFRAAGVPGTRLFFAPHAVDPTLFDPSRPEHQEAARNFRAELGLNANTHVVLFCGKLVDSKQPGLLLEAFLGLAHPGAVLVIAGDGPEKPALQARAAGEAERVRFLPFANQSAMPARYLLADLFVLPSRGFYETWGLAVNEAMHMGVPCLVSDDVGCQRDLVQDATTGWVFPAGDGEALTRKLREALDAPSEIRNRMRSAARERLSTYSYAQATSGLRAALAKALG